MIGTADLAGLAGNSMVGQDGSKIGKIVDVYESTDGPEATFVTVSTGLFGGGGSFVPLAKAELRGSDVVVPYDKALVKDAPRVEVDEELTAAEEDRLYQHYSLTGGAATTTATTTGTAPTAGAQGRHAGESAIPRGTQRRDGDGDGVFDDVAATAVGRDTSGLTTDDAMTRSEERLQVGVQRREAGRARLVKRISAEMQTATVQTTHQTARVVTEPITDANRDKSLDGPTLTEAVHEVVLTDEVPVVAKETVAVERVRLGTETVTEQATVNEQVRKENIELDDDGTTPRRS